MLFVMEYAGISMGEPLDFFRRFYAPAWSVLHWIHASPSAIRPLSAECLEQAVSTHAMAMFLHSLDDHLNDGQVAASHLTILLRSQAWLRMRVSLNTFADGLFGGSTTADEFIDSYFAGITETGEPESLEAYCELFRRQMATWLIVPVLAARMVTRNEEFVSGVRAAYESFGIAWRLLDDLQDIGKDLESNGHSAVYTVLSGKGRNLWNRFRNTSVKKRDPVMQDIAERIKREAVIETIIQKICEEMETAESTAHRLGLEPLAAEYRSLAEPLTQCRKLNK
jgi:geranylgeranyl pyrophosphate synthase